MLISLALFVGSAILCEFLFELNFLIDNARIKKRVLEQLYIYR